MFKVGEKALRSGAEVEVLGKAEGKNVCRYINTNVGNRCYLYSDDELTKIIEKSLISFHRLQVVDDKGQLVAQMPFNKFPSEEEILRVMDTYGGADSWVIKVYKRV